MLSYTATTIVIDANVVSTLQFRIESYVFNSLLPGGLSELEISLLKFAAQTNCNLNPQTNCDLKY